MFACLALALLSASGCTGDSVIGPSSSPTAVAAVTDSNRVEDLAVVVTTDSSATVSWTDVSDGRGRPARYRLKYAVPPIVWGDATIGCDRTMNGSTVGGAVSCTMEGLAAATAYDFQLMSYRLVNGSWVGAVYSNVATGSTSSPAPIMSGVDDLAVVGGTANSLTVQWTQVDDGTGQPARYRVKYATPPIQYAGAPVGCDEVGTAIGASASCTITGLDPETRYDVQLMSYREADGLWEGALYSNLAQAATEAQANPQQSVAEGVWVDRATLMARPTSGAEWQRLLYDAGRDPGSANISNQDSNHDVLTLAAALVCVRTGQYCAKARQGVIDAIGTEAGARWLAVGRNLASYVIAADLLDLRAGGSTGTDGARVEQWVEGWLTKQLSENNNTSVLRGFEPFRSSANAAAQEGFAFAAVAAYLGDPGTLDLAWDAFRTYACDPGAPDPFNINLDPPVQDNWVHDAQNPCGVNPAGTVKRVPSGLRGAGGTYRIDGALVGDMRRGGVYQWTPGYTQYPWVGLEGFIPAAVVLQRAGYPAFEVANRVVYRTLDYLLYLRNETGDLRWFDGTRASEVVSLVNTAYGVSFPLNETVGQGRTVGYTSWTHPTPQAFALPGPVSVP